MSQLQDNLNEILRQKNTYLLPANLKKDVTVLGVTGTLESLDTSDADATAADIAQGKTAYVDGVKITGTAVASHDSVKLFVSTTAMNNDNDKVLGDIAIVYNNSTLTGLYVVTSVNDTLTYTPLPTQLSAITSGDVYLNKVVMGANNNIVTGTIPVTASEVDTAEDTTETILGNDTEDFDDVFQEMIEHETNKQGATRTYTDVTNLSGIDDNFASKLTNTVQDEHDGMAVSNEYITYLSSKAVALGIAKYTTTKYNTTYYSTELIFLVDPTYNLSSVLDAPSNEGACQVTDTTLHVYRGFGDNCDFTGVDYGNNNYKVIAFNNELTEESERNSRYTNIINSVTAGTYTIDIYQRENQNGSSEDDLEEDDPLIPLL